MINKMFFSLIHHLLYIFNILFPVRLGKGIDKGELLVYEPVLETWQNVCADDWNSTWSNLTCKQLGYE